MTKPGHTGRSPIRSGAAFVLRKLAPPCIRKRLVHERLIEPLHESGPAFHRRIRPFRGPRRVPGGGCFHVTSFGARPEQSLRRRAAAINNLARMAVRRVFRQGLARHDVYRRY